MDIRIKIALAMIMVRNAISILASTFRKLSLHALKRVCLTPLGNNFIFVVAYYRSIGCVYLLSIGVACGALMLTRRGGQRLTHADLFDELLLQILAYPVRFIV